MDIIKLLTPRAIAAYYNEANMNTDDYLGLGLFPARKQAGLDLSWIKGSNGLPISLMPTAFDAKATFRDRIGVDKIDTEMPFFREGFKIKEKDRQELLRVQNEGDPYFNAVMDRVFNDAGNLIAGANVVPERMRMSLLFPEGGDMQIAIKANGVDYSYNYDPNGTWKSTNYSALTGNNKWDTNTADPIHTIDTIRKAMRMAHGTEVDTIIMNSATWEKFMSAPSVLARISATAPAYATDDEIRNVVAKYLNMSVVVYDKMYRDEDKVAHNFIPDGYISLIPNAPLGATNYGTTPEEADLMGSDMAEVVIVNTGVAISREIQQHPVNVNTFASEIVLPSFERMDDVACCKVY